MSQAGRLNEGEPNWTQKRAGGATLANRKGLQRLVMVADNRIDGVVDPSNCVGNHPSLEAKSVIVVGAGQTPGITIGNGRATALSYARHGAKLFLVDRDAVSLTATREMAEVIGNEPVHTYIADVENPIECSNIVAAARKALGSIDVLQNNVGILAGDRSDLETKSDVWDRIMNVNLRSVFLLSQQVAPAMRDAGGGAIVNVSSVGSLRAGLGTITYSVSKAGLNSLTQYLARTLANDNIRVNAVLPGLMDTPIGNDSLALQAGVDRDSWAAARASRVPMGRQGTAWDVAAASMFLASDDAKYITGALLPVDGGLSL